MIQFVTSDGVSLSDKTLPLCLSQQESNLVPVPETYDSITSERGHLTLLGCRQVVRHWFLVPAFGGSNPSTPAMKIVRPSGLAFFIVRGRVEPPNAFAKQKFGRFGVVNDTKKCLHFFVNERRSSLLRYPSTSANIILLKMTSYRHFLLIDKVFPM